MIDVYEFMPVAGPVSMSIDRECFNFFTGFKAANRTLTNKTKTEDLDTILYHFEHVLADGDKVLYEYIIRWFAHIVQFPHKKTATCLIFTSDEGAGKNSIFNFIGNRIFGREYFATYNDMEDVTGGTVSIGASLIKQSKELS